MVFHEQEPPKGTVVSAVGSHSCAAGRSRSWAWLAPPGFPSVGWRPGCWLCKPCGPLLRAGVFNCPFQLVHRGPRPPGRLLEHPLVGLRPHGEVSRRGYGRPCGFAGEASRWLPRLLFLLEETTRALRSGPRSLGVLGVAGGTHRGVSGHRHQQPAWLRRSSPLLLPQPRASEPLGGCCNGLSGRWCLFF